MIILILLFVVVIAVVVIRRQMYRQHREMMSAINPERLAQLDAIDRVRAQKVVNAFLCILGAFGLLFLLALCGQCQFKGFGPDPVKIESNEPVKAP
jgi:hypothetical protein